MRNIKRILIPSIEDILNHGASVVHRGFVGADGDEGASPGGIHQRSDVIATIPGLRTTTVDGQPLNEIWNDFQVQVAAFNRVSDALTGLLTYPVTRAQEKVAVPSNPGMQSATEFGRPTNIRTTLIARGYPLKHFDLGTGFTQEFLDSATALQVRQVQGEIEMAYSLLKQEVTLEALFTTANATDEAGISVKRLYNADGEIPPRWKRWTFDGTHTHYFASAGASIANADFDTLEETLIHHGFGDNGETLVIHAHRDDLPDIRALTNFVPAETADRPVITDGPVVGPTRGSTIPGYPAQGYIGQFVIVQNNLVPSGYLLAQAVGGLFGQRNPVGLRSHENPSARGLRLVEGSFSRYPLVDSVYDCYLGAGVGQRGAAAVMQITAGVYVSPTFET